MIVFLVICNKCLNDLAFNLNLNIRELLCCHLLYAVFPFKFAVLCDKNPPLDRIELEQFTVAVLGICGDFK